MRTLDHPATLRDVLSARNFVARIVVQCAQSFAAMVAIAPLFWLTEKIGSYFGNSELALVGIYIGLMVAVVWFIRRYLPFPESLTKSEKYLEETPELS